MCICSAQIQQEGSMRQERTGDDKNATCRFELGRVDVARNMARRASWRKGGGHAWMGQSVGRSTKSGGTFSPRGGRRGRVPTMRPLPLFNSSAMLTLLPGEDSMSSTLGILAPTLTKAGAEAWKQRREEMPRGGARGRRRRANIVGVLSVGESAAWRRSWGFL